jgi:hypothetical protein
MAGANKVTRVSPLSASTLICADLVNVFEVFLPQLLLYPNPTDPLNGEAAALLMREPEAYNLKVKGEILRCLHFRPEAEQSCALLRSNRRHSSLADLPCTAAGVMLVMSMNIAVCLHRVCEEVCKGRRHRVKRWL